MPSVEAEELGKTGEKLDLISYALGEGSMLTMETPYRLSYGVQTEIAKG